MLTLPGAATPLCWNYNTYYGKISQHQKLTVKNFKMDIVLILIYSRRIFEKESTPHNSSLIWPEGQYKKSFKKKGGHRGRPKSSC
jgi:hypothetical protein